MGRSKYSPETRNAVMAAYVTATKKIIDTEGIDRVSIRRVSNETGYSSATLYLYFDDMNELVTMSLISYLGDYVRDIIETTPANETPSEAYRRSWALFCDHAFANPSVFLNLYYGPKAGTLDAIAQKYYELFPSELEKASGIMLDMLGKGNLRKRNRVVMESFAQERGLTDHEIEIANDLTIAYFHTFLEEAAENSYSKEEREDLTERFLDGAFFIVRGSLS